MRTFYFKAIRAFIIIGMVLTYGCDQSINTKPDKKSEIEPIPFAASIPTAASDGLQPVDYSIPAGTNFVTAGVGTASKDFETISVEVPAGSTVEKVFLYWARRDDDSPAPSTIEINGRVYTGSEVGGPVNLTNSNIQKTGITYRLNLTGEGIVGPGMNSFAVRDNPPNPSEPLGASVLVFYSAGGQESTLTLYDGIDFLWDDATSTDPDRQEALRTAVPVTFTFGAAAEERIAELTLFIGDIEPIHAADRPNSLKITIGDGPTQTIGPPDDTNPFQAFQGAEWDSYTKTITIPAGVSKVTVEPVSGPDISDRFSPASLIWSLAGLSVPVPQENGGGQGCTPGYWKQSQHFDSWVTYAPSDDLTDTFGSNDYPLAKPEKGTANALNLLQGLQLRGGKVNALTRHAVAALLNASNPDVSYDLSLSEVQSIFNDAVEDGSKKVIEAAKDKFADFNEQGCPLN